MKHIYQQRLGMRFVWSLQYEWSECCWLASFLPAKTNRCPHPFVLDTCSCICWTPVSVSMRTSTEQKLYCSCLVYMLLEFYIREYFKVFALSSKIEWTSRKPDCFLSSELFSSLHSNLPAHFVFTGKLYNSVRTCLPILDRLRPDLTYSTH